MVRVGHTNSARGRVGGWTSRGVASHPTASKDTNETTMNTWFEQHFKDDHVRITLAVATAAASAVGFTLVLVGYVLGR
jgi:hypothetical protein